MFRFVSLAARLVIAVGVGMATMLVSSAAPATAANSAYCPGGGVASGTVGGTRWWAVSGYNLQHYGNGVNDPYMQWMVVWNPPSARGAAVLCVRNNRATGRRGGYVGYSMFSQSGVETFDGPGGPISAAVGSGWQALRMHSLPDTQAIRFTLRLTQANGSESFTQICLKRYHWHTTTTCDMRGGTPGG